MFWPALLIGLVAFFAGKSIQAPSPPGLIGKAAPPVIKRSGERCRFELGAPYRIDATTAALNGNERARLYSLLTFGTYHARQVTFSSMPNGDTAVRLCFVSPKTTTVPIGQPLDWDLGDGRVRLVLRQVARLDGRSC